MSQTEPDLRSIWSHLDSLAFTQGYVEANGHRTRYVNAGPKDAPPVVMVHGMGGSWENFIANFAAYAQHFNTYAYDLLGHGYSAKPDQVFAVEDYVQQLGGFISATGLRNVRLFGLSIGGWTSTKFTVRHPELVEKLVVMSAWGRPRPEETPEMKALLMKELDKRLKAVDEPSYAAMDDVFAGLIANPKDRMQDLLALRLRIYKQPGMSKTMRQVFGGLAPQVWDKNMLTDDELKSVSRPTLLMACVDHPDIFLTHAREYRSLIPNVQWVEILGASHWPQWETAEAVNRHSLEFFRAA